MRSPTPRQRLADVVLAALLLAATAVTVPLSASASGSPPPLLSVPWAVLITVPLAIRRVAPAAAAVVVVAMFAAGQLVGVPELVVSQIAPFVALYSVGAWSADRRRATVVRAVLVALLVVLLALQLAAGAPTAAVFTRSAASPALIALTTLTNLLYLAAAVAFGETAWRSAGRHAELEERAAERAVSLERLRIARDLHDVVAHHVSVIGVQAGAARRTLLQDPQVAAAALQVVESSAHQAVDELRRTLVALRAAGGDGLLDAASTAGVEQIPELIEEARRSGTSVEHRIEGEPRPLPPTIALTLYRVTQEALTNTRKHAGSGARAVVRLVYGEHEVQLEVVDVAGGPAAAGTSPGLGRQGMAERAAAVGGALEAGPVAGGYRVHVRIPLRA